MDAQVQPFRMPAVSLVGVGAAEKCGIEAANLGARQALLVTDPGVLKAGLCDTVAGYLRQAGLRVETYSRVQAEPPLENIEDCLEVLRAGSFDIVVGLGGGSALDVAKASAALLRASIPLSECFGVGKLPGRGLPVILLPTTAGTGSEVTQNAVFTDTKEQLKKTIVSPHILPDVAIVDPTLTVSCPPLVTAATGMDALTHAVESYTASRATTHTQLYALEAIRLIGRWLRPAVADGQNLEARAAMAWGSYFAGISLANAGVGMVHGLAYPLGGRYHVSHGISNALLLPYLTAFNIAGSEAHFAKIAEALGVGRGLSDAGAAHAGLEAIRRLSRDSGIPQHMRDVGVPEEAIPDMARAAVTNARLLANSPRPMTAEDAEQVYKQAF